MVGIPFIRFIPRVYAGRGLEVLDDKRHDSASRISLRPILRSSLCKRSQTQNEIYLRPTFLVTRRSLCDDASRWSKDTSLDREKRRRSQVRARCIQRRGLVNYEETYLILMETPVKPEETLHILVKASFSSEETLAQAYGDIRQA
jgi:hypothetical protein